MMVDTSLNQLGIEKDIAATVSHYMAAPWLVINSDLIVTVPGRITKTISDVLPLETF